jgi:5-methyltetrahydropteroyltriglutamate--homocysteine methyltransferase
LATFCEDRFYKSYNKYLFALAHALQQEYKAIADTGVILQVDAPCLAMGRHTRHSTISDDEFLKVLHSNVDAINFALGSIDPSQVRVHVCWGNYAGPHHKDFEAARIWPELLRLQARYISIEGANPRHSHDIQAFSQKIAAQFIEMDKVLLPGVIDTRTPIVEHPDLVAHRILQYARVLGPGRVVASTDCGMATTAKSAAITDDIAWMKLEALVEGARRARCEFINLGSPAPTSVAYAPTGFRAVLFCEDTSAKLWKAFCAQLGSRAWSLTMLPCDSEQKSLELLRYAIDTPTALIAFNSQTAKWVKNMHSKLEKESDIARRPFSFFSVGACQSGFIDLGDFTLEDHIPRVLDTIQVAMQAPMRFDKQRLVPQSTLLNPPCPPTETDVVVVGAGLLGLLTAVQLTRRGFKVAVLGNVPLLVVSGRGMLILILRSILLKVVTASRISLVKMGQTEIIPQQGK